MTNLSLAIFLGVILTIIGFSCHKFYKEKQYRVMIAFTILGAVLAYYFKGITDARTAVGGIGVEGIFMAVTVMIIFLMDGIIGQFVSIYLSKEHSRNSKIAVSIGGIFMIVSSIMTLINIL